MFRTIHRQLGTPLPILAILMLAVWAQPHNDAASRWEADAVESPSALTESPESGVSPPARADARDNYYLIRSDLRRCASPLCGGYWVKRVNFPRTRCANGRWMTECYVAEIDWNNQPQIDTGQTVLRGRLVTRQFQRFGNLGAFRVSESWKAANDNPPAGTFFRVRDRGVRCITHPCLSHQQAKLNTTIVKYIAGVDLARAKADDALVAEASAAMTRVEGVIVTGYNATVTGPGGRAQTLRATQFYLRAGQSTGSPPVSTAPGKKPCIKTGCSSQVCADHEVVTTCEFRPEYACYQKAVCERQADGSCGFTKTPELTSCLRQSKEGR